MSHWHDLFLSTLASRKWSWWTLVSHHSSKKAATVNPAWLPITLTCGALYHKSQFEFHCRTVRHWDKLTASRQRWRRRRSSHRVANDIFQNQCSVKAAITSVDQEEILMGICFLQHPGPSVSGDISVVLAAKGYVELPLGTPKHFIAMQNELCRQQSFLMKPHCLTELTPAHCKLQEQL